MPYKRHVTSRMSNVYKTHGLLDIHLKHKGVEHLQGEEKVKIYKESSELQPYVLQLYTTKFF